MDQSRKAAKPARGQLNTEIKYPCRCIRGKYIYLYCCLYLLIYHVYFLFGDKYIRARFTAVYACMCDYSGMDVYIYICMVITYSKGKDQPGKVANPTRGQLAEQRK